MEAQALNSTLPVSALLGTALVFKDQILLFAMKTQRKYCPWPLQTLG
jgi:hypothetical protein